MPVFSNRGVPIRIEAVGSYGDKGLWREVRPGRRRRRGHRRRLTFPKALAGAGVCLLFLAIGVRLRSGEAPAVAAVAGNDAPVRSAAVRAPRTVYPHSVIRGGVYSAAELDQALDRDPVAAAHYAGFNRASSRPIRAEAASLMYASYRVGDRVYWTRKPVRIAAGEGLLTDGTNLARSRCGNRLSREAVAPTGPEVDLDSPETSPWEAVAGRELASSPPRLVHEIFPGLGIQPGGASPAGALSGVSGRDVSAYAIGAGMASAVLRLSGAGSEAAAAGLTSPAFVSSPFPEFSLPTIPDTIAGTKPSDVIPPAVGYAKPPTGNPAWPWTGGGPFPTLYWLPPAGTPSSGTPPQGAPQPGATPPGETVPLPGPPVVSTSSGPSGYAPPPLPPATTPIANPNLQEADAPEPATLLIMASGVLLFAAVSHRLTRCRSVRVP